ncbi:MAG: hypothetical protein R2713_17345 [Ilumatobacteraceae bacterium]
MTDGIELPSRLRDALAGLAEAMHAHATDEAEVQGYALAIGDLGLSAMPGPYVSAAQSCWGFISGTCAWFSRTDDDSGGDPKGCGIYNVTK